MSRTLKVFVALNAVALGAYAVYLLPVPELRTYLFDLRPVSTVYLALRSGERFPITTIEPLATDIDTFAKGAGNLQTFQPLFGYRLEYFHPEVVAGPVRLERDGYFNMTNPSGYVFPEINNTRPFRRIPVSERRQLDDFVNRRQPDWKIPLVQRILNRLALLALFFGILLLLMHARPHARKLRLT